MTVENLELLVGQASAGQTNRRTFLARAAALGVSAPLAAGLFDQAVGAAPAGRPTPRFSFQDGGETLVVAIPQATVQLDPGLAGGNGYGDIIPVADNITEGLTRFKLGSAEIEPALAESWTSSEDGLTHVFTLRSGVTFHDGTPFDAAAVVTNIHRQLDPNHPLYNEGFVYGGLVFNEYDTVEATGDLEVTVTLLRPISTAIGNLAVFAAGIVSPTALETYKDDYSQNAAGTGPFKVVSFTQDVELVLEAFEEYWGGRPKLDRVVFRTIAEDTVRLAELQAGSIDVANQIDFKDVEAVEGDENLQVISGDFLNVQFIGLNQAVAPLDNPAVRKAFQFAVNKQNIADVAFYGNYTLGAGPIAPGLVGHDASLAEVYPYDPEQAKTLLSEAGVTDVTIDFYNRANSFWPLIGQLIQADMAEVGITLNLVSLQDAEFFDKLGTGEVPAFINDWTWDNGDPDNVQYSLFTAPRAVTRLGYKNDRVNELNTEAQTEQDSAKRTELYLEAQKLILEDSVFVVLGYPKRAIGASTAVQNLQLSPVGSLVLREVDLA